ncbi:MAG: GNAT family N-acetyltransferase [Aquitalea sp.]|nr:GNAT family N-acetyltransferase [Aquitalea sp.]
MSQYRIRKPELADAAALAALMAAPSCYGNTLQLPYPSLSLWQQRLSAAEPLKHALLLETGAGQVIAHGSLWRESVPRLAHGARLGMAVHQDWQGKGVGSALLQALLELADNWLGLHRVELTVFTDNAAALALYRKFGFEQEARLRAYALRDGRYEDVLKMARLRPFPLRQA